MLAEKITRTSFVTLHLHDGRVFDGVIIADFGGCIQLMPKGCSINFNLPKDEVDVVSIEEGQGMPRYTMNMLEQTRNVMAQEFLDRFAA